MNAIIDKHIESWSVYNALALIIAFITALVYKELNILLITFSLSILVLIFINQKRLRELKPVFGIANAITLIRFLIIAFSFLWIDFNETNLLFFSLSIAVALDFFDGLAARFFNETSFFGQYFDMEIDAFFVLLMCTFYFMHGKISWWILIPGLLRYVYRMYTFCFPKPNTKEQKKTYATVIAASYFIVLLVGLITQGNFQFWILLLGSLAIIISFIIGFIQYQKQ